MFRIPSPCTCRPSFGRLRTWAAHRAAEAAVGDVHLSKQQRGNRRGLRSLLRGALPLRDVAPRSLLGRPLLPHRPGKWPFPPLRRWRPLERGTTDAGAHPRCRQCRFPLLGGRRGAVRWVVGDHDPPRLVGQLRSGTAFLLGPRYPADRRACRLARRKRLRRVGAGAARLGRRWRRFGTPVGLYLPREPLFPGDRGRLHRCRFPGIRAGRRRNDGSSAAPAGLGRKSDRKPQIGHLASWASAERRRRRQVGPCRLRCNGPDAPGSEGVPKRFVGLGYRGNERHGEEEEACGGRGRRPPPLTHSTVFARQSTTGSFSTESLRAVGSGPRCTIGRYRGGRRGGDASRGRLFFVVVLVVDHALLGRAFRGEFEQRRDEFRFTPNQHEKFIKFEFVVEFEFAHADAIDGNVKSVNDAADGVGRPSVSG